MKLRPWGLTKVPSAMGGEEEVEPLDLGDWQVIIAGTMGHDIAHLTPAALHALTQWIEVAQIGGGPLFRPVYGKFAIDRFMNPIALTRVLKKLATQAGFTAEEVLRISGHSLRVGRRSS